MVLLWVRKENKCGELLPYAFSRQFRRKEMVERLKMRVIRYKSVNFLSNL